MDTPNVNTVEVIYELREAVESKARAEYELDATGTPDARDALLTAQLDVEAKTQDAIELCTECGQNHLLTEDQHVHSRVNGRRDNVIAVDFRREAEPA